MKILIIEDNHDVRLSLEQILTEAGYLVDAVAEGSEGIYRACNWEYDAIILDVMLPGVDGWGVLAKIREQIRAPVVMLTARGELQDRLKGLDSGADDFIVKPFEPEELLARLRAVMRRSFGQIKNHIDLGRFQIDLAKKEVTRDGKLIALTPAEFRILVYLAQRAGQIISTTEIIDTVNDDAHEADPSVLKVQIYQLRKKLDKDLIVNRRNLGYIIEKP